jgi:hypothetical protein
MRRMRISDPPTLGMAGRSTTAGPRVVNKGMASLAQSKRPIRGVHSGSVPGALGEEFRQSR